MLISPLKMCVASVELPWLETAHFQKCAYICEMFCAMLQSTLHYESVNFFCPDKGTRHFLCLCVHNTDTRKRAHTHSIYTHITEYYICI
jgi:hypothetical protein